MKKTLSFILICAFITTIFTGCEKTKEQQFGEAVLHEQNARNDLAVPIYRKLANSGYAPAQVKLAIYYMNANGEERISGREKNCDALIMKLIQKAADQGYAPAFALLGDAFYGGDYGVDKNLEKAKEYHYKAVQQDYIPSMHKLAYILRKQGNSAEAESWWEKANKFKEREQAALWPERYKSMEEERKRAQEKTNADAGMN